MTHRALVFIAICLAGGAALSGQPRRSGAVAIRGGTILTATHGAIANGTIVMRDGRITAIGQNIAIPADWPAMTSEVKVCAIGSDPSQRICSPPASIVLSK